ncbi:MAG TPA: hypothetical protein VG797_06825, partial [Phycisphaerales bacterium]|nr:hypothetical protein [Phycisphaerales bacterium]
MNDRTTQPVLESEPALDTAEPEPPSPAISRPAPLIADTRPDLPAWMGVLRHRFFFWVWVGS